MPSWWRERPRDVGKPSKVAATSPMLVMMVNMLVMMVNIMVNMLVMMVYMMVNMLVMMVNMMVNMLVMMVNMLVMMVNMPRRPNNSFKGGERGGQHADPDQWDDGPVERDQSQVFLSFSDTFCSE